jgi:hypothetical protein
MANFTCFASALLLGFIHLLLVILCRPPTVFSLVILGGIWSSLWNHAFTNDAAKWADRIMMGVGFVFNVLYLRDALRPASLQWPLLALMLFAMVSYFSAKYSLSRGDSGNVPSKKERAGASNAAKSTAWGCLLFDRGNIPHLLAHCILSSCHFIMLGAFAAGETSCESLTMPFLCANPAELITFGFS